MRTGWLIVGAALAAVLAAPCLAQQPSSPCSAPGFRQFDFWLGEWEVRNPQGQRVGTNSITSILGGCVLQENWTSTTSTHAGTSYNIFDAVAGTWHQTWVDNAGLLLQLDGRFFEGKLVLEGQRPGKDGHPVEHRISWEPVGENRVRQLWESSTDGGQTWGTVFDGLYVKNNP